MQTKTLNLPKLLPLSLALVMIPLTACQVEKKQAARLPEVNVDVESGQLPKYNIEGPDVKVGVAKRAVTVPKLILVQEKETIEVPYIDVNVPGAEQKEQTIKTEVEVPSSGYNLAIQGVYAVNNQLVVVSKLEEENTNAPRATLRVSDYVVVNAPEVPVSHYIIGERPQGSFNENYTFISSRQEIASQLDSGQQLYKRPEEAA